MSKHPELFWFLLWVGGFFGAAAAAVVVWIARNDDH